MKGCYSTKLKPGATAFAITSPRRVPIPLLKQMENELKRMVEKNVITPVLEQTEWCSPVVNRSNMINEEKRSKISRLYG